MFSRVFLLLALVAMMMVGAFADRALLKSDGLKTGDKVKSYGKSKSSLKKACKKISGCKTCEWDETDPDFPVAVCIACSDKNAEVDPTDGTCVCVADYGTITKKQIKAYKTANKGSKHYGKYAKCVLCTDYDLEADAGVCIDPLA